MFRFFPSSRPSVAACSIAGLSLLLSACVPQNSQPQNGLNPNASQNTNAAAQPNSNSPLAKLSFKDANFRACVLEQPVQTPEAITELDCSLRNIQSADELHYFPALKRLDLSLNELTRLDLSGNPALESLKLFPSSLLENVTFGESPAIKHLELDGADTALVAPALQALPELETLTLGFEPLKSLSLDHLHLRQLSLISAKRLKSLTLNTPALEQLYVAKAPLQSLDLSSSQKLVNVELKAVPLSQLTLGEQPRLTDLQITHSRLNALELYGAPKLVRLTVSDSKLENVDLRLNRRIEELDLSNNRLSTLNLNHQRQLRRIFVKGNLLPKLDTLGQNSELLQRCLDRNQLDFTVEVFYLNCQQGNGYQVSSAELKKLGNLRELYLFLRPGVEELDLSDLTGLSNLHIVSRRQSLKRIQIPVSPWLEEIYLADNQLTDIRLPTLPKLTRLDLGDNQLRQVKIPYLPALKELSLTRNPLPRLQLPELSNLESLFLNQVGLEQVRLKQLPKLNELVLNGLNLSAIELDLPALKSLDLRGSPKMTKARLNISQATRTSLSAAAQQADSSD